MLGSNQNVRKTPVSSRTMKDHRAISPSMNDQCSGKTLRTGRSFLPAAARPRRSSSHPTGPAAFLPKPLSSTLASSLIAIIQLLLVPRQLRVARRDDVLEVAHRDQVPL